MTLCVDLALGWRSNSSGLWLLVLAEVVDHLFHLHVLVVSTIAADVELLGPLRTKLAELVEDGQEVARGAGNLANMYGAQVDGVVPGGLDIYSLQGGELIVPVRCLLVEFVVVAHCGIN